MPETTTLNTSQNAVKQSVVCRGSMDAIAEEFASATQAGMVLSYAADGSTVPPAPKPSCWRPPVSLSEARRRAQVCTAMPMALNPNPPENPKPADVMLLNNASC